jgi:tetratricopeptide (TPR) repeat protein
MAAIVHAHKSARVVDEDSVERYETRVLSEEQGASATALVECATFYHLAGGPDAGRAKDTARRALDLAPGDVRAKTLLGWIEMTGRGDGDAGDGDLGTGTGTASGVLTSARSATSRRRAAAAVRIFDEVLRSPDKGGEAAIDALLGKARAMTVLSRYDAAVDVMNELAARHPGFAPAASERAKARLAACDFEGAAENAHRGLAEDPEDIECHRVMVFLLLSREGDVSAARRQMACPGGCDGTKGTPNAFLFLETSRDAARVAGGDAEILGSCGRLLDKARSLRPDHAGVLCESAYQARLAGKYADAIELYAAAATAAEAEGRHDDLTPMYGTILCQILDRRVSEAASQLEFLEDIATDENDLVFAFLNALRAHAVNAADAEARADELQRRATPFLESVLKKPPAIDFFVECDPDVLVRCASLFSERDGGVDGDGTRAGGGHDGGPDDDGRNGSAESETETPRALRILEALCHRAPGARGAQEHLMRARFAAGLFEAAARTAHALLRVDDAHGEAHVTLARVHLAEGAHAEARRALDAAGGERLFGSRNHVVRRGLRQLPRRRGRRRGCAPRARGGHGAARDQTRPVRAGGPGPARGTQKQFGAHLCRRPRGDVPGVRARAGVGRARRRRRARRGAGSRRLRGDLCGGFGDGRAVRDGHGPGGRRARAARAQQGYALLAALPRRRAGTRRRALQARGPRGVRAVPPRAGRAPASGRLVSRAAGGGVPAGGPAASCRLRAREGCGARAERRADRTEARRRAGGDARL